jgi:histidine triad (HIT) family protein
VRNDCVFCAILDGELPSYEVGSDDKAFAFLDINPFGRGHTLVIPREHVADVLSTSEEVLAHIAPLVSKTARRLVDRLGSDGINIVQSNGPAAGQEVFHLHVHLVPRWKDDGLLEGFRRPRPPDVDLTQLHAELTNR